MLTKIEVDGFKSFADFSLDLRPFLVVLGQNASGKSNLFDAVQLLRRLAGRSLFDSFAEARGETRELFRVGGDGVPARRMKLAVEVLVEPEVVDQFGRSIEVTHTRLRYEVHIEQRADEDGFVRPYVVYEAALPIRSSDDPWARVQTVSKGFRQRHLRYARRGPLLETDANEAGQAIFRLAQEGRQGRKREIAAHAAEATVLSSITTAAEFPLLYALRRELESWRFLQLDPAALRRPSGREQRGEQLEPSGANLAKVLRRIQQRADGPDVLVDIAADLARVVRGLHGVDVEENVARDEWEVFLRVRDEGRVSARVASDGTLRVLALLAALYDPTYRGVVCFEEPENGIFPQRLRDLILLLRELVTDPSTADVGEPMSQLVVSSHSPLLLLSVPRSDVVFLDWVGRREQAGQPASRVTRVRRLREIDDVPLPIELTGEFVSEAERRAFPAVSTGEVRDLLGA